MKRHNRRSIRLPEYDYSKGGYYYVTICAQDRECIFGEIENGQMALNDGGKIVNNIWQWLKNQYGYVELDEFIVMPNHLHGIICINNTRRGGSRTKSGDTILNSGKICI